MRLTEAAQRSLLELARSGAVAPGPGQTKSFQSLAHKGLAKKLKRFSRYKLTARGEAKAREIEYNDYMMREHGLRPPRKSRARRSR